MSEIELDKATAATGTAPEKAVVDAEPEITTVAANTEEPEDDSAAGDSGESSSGAEQTSRRFAMPTLPELGRGGRTAVRAAAAVVAGAALASSIFLFLQNQEKQELMDAREAAQSAACAYAPILATYDAKNLDAYFTAVLNGATGDWHKQFGATSQDLREVLAQGQVVSKATDVQCAVRSGDRDSAEAIVVIGQTITSLGTQNKPSPGQLSMVMRLERQGDRWLVNKVNSPLAQQSAP